MVILCKNFWCKAQFVNKANEYYMYCPYCRSSQDFQGQIEVIKEAKSITYNLQELKDLLNNKGPKKKK